MSMEEENKKIIKKTMGRRKIEIKKIDKKSSLQVTFTKRRMGLFRKASELAVLCGAEIAILVQSPADKIFAFAHPSVDALVDRFHNSTELLAASSSWLRRYTDDGRCKYEEAWRKLEAEKRSVMEDDQAARDEFWWDEPLEGMEQLHELEEYVEAMEVLKDKLHEMEQRKLVEAPAPAQITLNIGGGGVHATYTPENWSAAPSSESMLGTTVSDLTECYDNSSINGLGTNQLISYCDDQYSLTSAAGDFNQGLDFNGGDGRSDDLSNDHDQYVEAIEVLKDKLYELEQCKLMESASELDVVDHGLGGFTSFDQFDHDQDFNWLEDCNWFQ